MHRERKIEILKKIQAGEISLADAKKMLVESSKRKGCLIIATYKEGEPDKINCGKEIITKAEFDFRFPGNHSNPMGRSGVLLVEIANPPIFPNDN